MNILGIRKKEKKKQKKGREEMKGEADWTGAVNVFFVLAFTKQLIMIRHIMKFILRRG